MKQPSSVGKCETEAGNHSPGAQSKGTKQHCYSCQSLAGRYKTPRLVQTPHSELQLEPQPGPTWLLYDIEDRFATGVLIVLEAHHAVVLILVGAVHSILAPVTWGGVEHLSEPSWWEHTWRVHTASNTHALGKNLVHCAPSQLLPSSCTVSISSRHTRPQDCCSTSVPRSYFLHSTHSLKKRGEVL